MAASVGDAVVCPYCGEALPGVVRACPHCTEDLTALAAADVADQVAEATRADAAAGRFRPVGPGSFRRFRVPTIVWSGAVLACAVLIAAFTGARGGWEGLAIFGWIFGLLFLPIAATYAVKDLLLPGPETLTTPDRTLRTFVKCLREKRWEYARSLVAPRALEGFRTRPAIEKLRLDREEYDMEDPAEFRAYWATLLFSSGGTQRYNSAGGLVAQEEGEDRAVACGEISVTAFPMWVNILILSPVIAFVVYMLIRKTERLSLEFPLLRVDRRWYLLDAVPPLGDEPRGLSP